MTQATAGDTTPPSGIMSLTAHLFFQIMVLTSSWMQTDQAQEVFSTAMPHLNSRLTAIVIFRMLRSLFSTLTSPCPVQQGKVVFVSFLIRELPSMAILVIPILEPVK